MSKLLSCLSFLILFGNMLFASDVIGFWKTIDEDSGKPESIIAIYEHKGKYYGRIIVTYDNNGNVQDSIEKPKKRAKGVIGNPFYSGLDIMWDLTPKGSKYVNGEILDPERGKIYDAKMWRDGENLIVRGELLIFGRNQKWPQATDRDFPSGFTKPNLAEMSPNIPEVKSRD